MKNNLGKTKIRTKQRCSNGLQHFDNLPLHLREWLRNASLPWRPSSVFRVYNRALAKSGNHELAIEELERLQEYQLEKDRLI